MTNVITKPSDITIDMARDAFKRAAAWPADHGPKAPRAFETDLITWLVFGWNGEMHKHGGTGRMVPDWRVLPAPFGGPATAKSATKILQRYHARIRQLVAHLVETGEVAESERKQFGHGHTYRWITDEMRAKAAREQAVEDRATKIARRIIRYVGDEAEREGERLSEYGTIGVITYEDDDGAPNALVKVRMSLEQAEQYAKWLEASGSPPALAINPNDAESDRRDRGLPARDGISS